MRGLKLNQGITQNMRNKLLMNAEELCGALGIELQDKHGEKVAEKKDYEEKRKAQKRQFYYDHREECLARQKAYNMAHREERNAKARVQQKAYREAHREEVKARQRAWYEAHREEVSAYYKQRYAERKARKLAEAQAVSNGI